MSALRLPRRRLPCVLLVLAALAAPALSGCGGDEPSSAAALAKSGLLGGMVSGLKRADDEADVQEARETEPVTREERVEAREQAEAAAQEAAPAEEGEGG